jgi:hypothetical protein
MFGGTGGECGECGECKVSSVYGFVEELFCGGVCKAVQEVKGIYGDSIAGAGGVLYIVFV